MIIISAHSFSCLLSVFENMPKDLSHPSQSDEASKHKLKRLIQSPNSFFMDVKCPGCFHITTIFSHAQVNLISVVSYISNITPVKF